LTLMVRADALQMLTELVQDALKLGGAFSIGRWGGRCWLSAADFSGKRVQLVSALTSHDYFLGDTAYRPNLSVKAAGRPCIPLPATRRWC
jgi:hypothetical protein